MLDYNDLISGTVTKITDGQCIQPARASTDDTTVAYRHWSFAEEIESATTPMVYSAPDPESNCGAYKTVSTIITMQTVEMSRQVKSSPPPLPPPPPPTHTKKKKKKKKPYILICALNKYSNQPARPRSLIGVFVVRTKKLCILGYSISAHVVNLRLAHMSEGTFSDVAAQLLKCRNLQ